MSIRQIAAAFCFSGSILILFLANLALADDQPSEFTSAGKTEISEIGYNSHSGADCNCNQGCSCSQCNQDCGCGNDCCCQGEYHWMAGVEATYLETVEHSSESWGMHPGPRIWLGVEGMDGWGARVRYWQLNASQFEFNQTSSTLAADSLSNLDLFTIDAEVTKRGELGAWKWLGSFGGRYAADRQLESFDNFYESVPLSLYIAEKFQYAVGGITTGLELSRPIGWGGLEVFSTLRVSPMWGNGSASEIDRQLAGSTPSVTFESHHAGIDMTIWEAQVGLQCSKYLECCQGTLFARCGFEFQGWSFAPSSNVAVSNLDLYGVAASVGFTR